MFNRDKNFDSFELVYCVQVYDYISCKYFNYKDSFKTYDEAHKFIENYDFFSDFGESPIGISIVSMPKVDFKPEFTLGVSDDFKKE